MMKHSVCCELMFFLKEVSDRNRHPPYYYYNINIAYISAFMLLGRNNSVELKVTMVMIVKRDE